MRIKFTIYDSDGSMVHIRGKGWRKKYSIGDRYLGYIINKVDEYESLGKYILHCEIIHRENKPIEPQSRLYLRRNNKIKILKS